MKGALYLAVVLALVASVAATTTEATTTLETTTEDTTSATTEGTTTIETTTEDTTTLSTEGTTTEDTTTLETTTDETTTVETEGTTTIETTTDESTSLEAEVITTDATTAASVETKGTTAIDTTTITTSDVTWSSTSSSSTPSTSSTSSSSSSSTDMTTTQENIGSTSTTTKRMATTTTKTMKKKKKMMKSTTKMMKSTTSREINGMEGSTTSSSSTSSTSSTSSATTQITTTSSSSSSSTEDQAVSSTSTVSHKITLPGEGSTKTSTVEAQESTNVPLSRTNTEVTSTVKSTIKPTTTTSSTSSSSPSSSATMKVTKATQGCGRNKEGDMWVSTKCANDNRGTETLQNVCESGEISRKIMARIPCPIKFCGKGYEAVESSKPRTTLCCIEYECAEVPEVTEPETPSTTYVFTKKPPPTKPVKPTPSTSGSSTSTSAAPSSSSSSADKTTGILSTSSSSPPKDTCESHNHCKKIYKYDPSHRYCNMESSMCVECTESKHCGDGYICKESQCVMDSGSCKSKKDCKDEAKPFCGSDFLCHECEWSRQCGEESVCLDNMCITHDDFDCEVHNDCKEAFTGDQSKRYCYESECSECSLDKHCQQGYECEDGSCIEEVECVLNKDCKKKFEDPMKQYCDIDANVCVECAWDNHCEGSDVCEDGTCMAYVECKTSRDCKKKFKDPFKQYCDADFTCVQCEWDNHCGPDAICEDGTCVPYYECKATKDCKDNKDPLKQYCDIELRECTVCLKDKHCGDGEVCSMNTCVPMAVAPCKKDKDCATQFDGDDDHAFCNSEGECIACMSDKNCQTGYVCMDEMCVAPPGECEVHNDCKDLYDGEERNRYCDKNECVQCKYDKHCSNDLVCKSNICVDNIQKDCGSQKHGAGWIVQSCVSNTEGEATLFTKMYCESSKEFATSSSPVACKGPSALNCADGKVPVLDTVASGDECCSTFSCKKSRPLCNGDKSCQVYAAGTPFCANDGQCVECLYDKQCVGDSMCKKGSCVKK